MTLQETLDRMKTEFEAGRFPLKPTDEQLRIMERATDDLIASGQADRALGVGDTAPDFELMDSEGALLRSADLLANGPVVLSFYRGVWCPYCNMELQALEAARPDIEKRGARLIAISPQTAANSRKSRRDNKLNFPILSDPAAGLADDFGLRFTLPDDLITVYKSFGNDLPQINDTAGWVLPMPARYIIGTDGVIVYAEVNPDYTQRPDPSELLPVLDRLRG